MTMNDDERRLAWDQREDESDKLYSYFMQWLSMPDRNMTTVCKKLGMSYGRMRDLSSDYGWKSRAAAYDQHRAREIAEATAKERLAAASAIARDIREIAEARLTIPAEDRDPAGAQKLSAALKAITPAMDDPSPSHTVKLDVENLYTAVRRREQLREDDEEDDGNDG
jgi:hypothetical protein